MNVSNLIHLDRMSSMSINSRECTERVSEMERSFAEREEASTFMYEVKEELCSSLAGTVVAGTEDGTGEGAAAASRSDDDVGVKFIS